MYGLEISAYLLLHVTTFQSTIPHSYAYIDIKIDKLKEIRSELKADSINVSVNDFVTKAVAHALVECPSINTLYQNGQVSI